MSEDNYDRKYVRLLAEALAVSLSIVGILPARSQSLTLEASTLAAQPGQTVMLTARADQRVTAPNFLMILDAYNVFSLNACQDTDVCTAPVTKDTPVGPGAAAYSAAIGTDAAHPRAVNRNGCCYPSWLFRPKLYASRAVQIPPGFTSQVTLTSDGGGDQQYGPWRISIFNASTGALVGECQNLSFCIGTEDNMSGASYQTVVSLGGTDRNSAVQNDARAISSVKCVDPPAFINPTVC